MPAARRASRPRPKPGWSSPIRRRSPARLWLGGRLRPLPSGTLLGVPGDLRAAAPVLGFRGTARALLDRVLPATATDDDPAVGTYVRARLGDRVVDRLVDPLLGGVYAGRADQLSLRMTTPQLVPALGRALAAGGGPPAGPQTHRAAGLRRRPVLGMGQLAAAARGRSAAPRSCSAARSPTSTATATAGGSTASATTRSCSRCRTRRPASCWRRSAWRCPRSRTRASRWPPSSSRTTPSFLRRAAFWCPRLSAG